MIGVLIYQLKTSPAYQGYKDNITRINQVQTDFQNLLLLRLVPDLSQNQTNIVSSIVSNYLGNININSTVVSNVPSSITLEVRDLDFRYWGMQGQYYIDIQGYTFQIGDYLLGSPIQYYDPLQIRTTTTIYNNSKLKNERGSSNGLY